jgi:hypothetical protein
MALKKGTRALLRYARSRKILTPGHRKWLAGATKQGRRRMGAAEHRKRRVNLVKQAYP